MGNVADRVSALEVLGYAWPALLAAGLWIYGWFAAKPGRKVLGRIGGWLVLAWAALRWPNGATAFLAVLAAFLVLHAVVPAAVAAFPAAATAATGPWGRGPGRRRARCRRPAHWQPGVVRMDVRRPGRRETPRRFLGAAPSTARSGIGHPGDPGRGQVRAGHRADSLAGGKGRPAAAALRAGGPDTAQLSDQRPQDRARPGRLEDEPPFVGPAARRASMSRCNTSCRRPDATRRAAWFCPCRMAW